MNTYFRDARTYIADTQRELLSWQTADGAWPAKAWIAASGGEGQPYATAFAALTLSIPERRLSIYDRRPPQLPVEAAAAGE